MTTAAISAITSNVAYNVHTSTDVVYDLPTSSGNRETESNIPTTTNEAYDVTCKARSGCTYTLFEPSLFNVVMNTVRLIDMYCDNYCSIKT